MYLLMESVFIFAYCIKRLWIFRTAGTISVDKVSYLISDWARLVLLVV